MTESAKTTAILPPELDRLRRDMIAAIDETLALVNPQWTIRELRLAVNADGRVDPSPLLRRRPRRHTPPADYKINLPGRPADGAGGTGGPPRKDFFASSSGSSAWATLKSLTTEYDRKPFRRSHLFEVWPLVFFPR